MPFTLLLLYTFSRNIILYNINNNEKKDLQTR